MMAKAVNIHLNPFTDLVNRITALGDQITPDAVNLASNASPSKSLMVATYNKISEDESLSHRNKEDLLNTLQAAIDQAGQIQGSSSTGSDHAITKLTRPIITLFIALVCAGLTTLEGLQVTWWDLPETTQEQWMKWLGICIMFFFGSRGLEKLSKVIAGGKLPGIKNLGNGNS